jgi:hypothetical protein
MVAELRTLQLTGSIEAIAEGASFVELLADKGRMGFSCPEDRLEARVCKRMFQSHLWCLRRFAEKLSGPRAEGCMTIRRRKLRASGQAKMDRTDSASS